MRGESEAQRDHPSYLVGIDGGGTRTTIAIADATGREVHRQTGPAGIVDAQRPAATAEMLAALTRGAAENAGMHGPAAALCAGLAGVGNEEERRVVQEALKASGIAERVEVLSDGETALFGAFGNDPGILVISGTGSVAYGRSESGEVVRCGGWGMVLGDEGAGYAIGKAGLRAALLAADGRGMETVLLPRMLEVLGLPGPAAIPPWTARAPKSEVARLALELFDLAESDRVAHEIVVEAALDLAVHVTALVRRLAPWSAVPRVALHGGAARHPVYRSYVVRVLEQDPAEIEIIEAAPDAVRAAIEYARSEMRNYSSSSR